MVLCLINKYTCPDQTKKIMDDIGLLYASSEWKNFDADTDLSKITIIPNSEEVDRIELRKRDDYARHNLEAAKRKHANKMKTIKQKMAKVKDEQEQLETNLVKFNAFVKEKQLKVERGSKTEQEEKELREAMTEDIEQKEATMVELTEARVSLIWPQTFKTFLNEGPSTASEAAEVNIWSKILVKGHLPSFNCNRKK